MSRNTPHLIVSRSLIALFLLGMTPGWGVASSRSPSTETAPPQASEAGTAESQDTAQERARVERTIQAELEQVGAGIQRLQTRMDQLSEETRQRAEASLADLEQRKATTRRKLEEIKIGGEAMWDRVHQALKASMDELGRLYERMAPSI